MMVGCSNIYCSLELCKHELTYDSKVLLMAVNRNCYFMNHEQVWFYFPMNAETIEHGSSMVAALGERCDVGQRARLGKRDKRGGLLKSLTCLQVHASNVVMRHHDAPYVYEIASHRR